MFYYLNEYSDLIFYILVMFGISTLVLGIGLPNNYKKSLQ